MKEFIRRIFVVLWIVFGLLGVAALGSLDGDAVGAWLLAVAFISAVQYVVTGSPNPIHMFDPKD